jgi:hypothetical protein
LTALKLCISDITVKKPGLSLEGGMILKCPYYVRLEGPQLVPRSTFFYFPLFLFYMHQLSFCSLELNSVQGTKDVKTFWWVV